jgi:DNA helicase-2/ATP-dependent DNA helicase PcrA
MFTPRPRQQEVLAYRGGKMGVSAVPGSGKTQILSLLAADIAASGVLADDQEVLIVTLVNSAVDNFAHRVGALIQSKGLEAGAGYRVRTLHGLAHDIVRERPALVGLPEDFDIVDERSAGQILEDAALAWLSGSPYALDEYLLPEMDENRRELVRRDDLPNLVNGIALNFIRFAKDLQATPIQLRERLDRSPLPLPLAEMGAAIYADYQRALANRGAVDFDDLVRLALRALQLDPGFLQRLRRRWPFILEDEAQDSNRLQERILRLLAGPDGNWVRVGDPNQAIYETFTTASPRYLREFLREPGVAARELPNSGRSTLSIIRLANRLIEWTQQEHPLEEARGALQPPFIEPAPADDPQPNPPDDPEKVYISTDKLGPQDEIQVVADSISRWLPEHPDETVAALVPRNSRGYELVYELKRRGIEAVEILQSTNATRMAAGALANVLDYLSDPHAPAKLARTYEVWRRADREDPDAWEKVSRIAEIIRRGRRVEDYLWPSPERDWLEDLSVSAASDEDNAMVEELSRFRRLVQRWLGAALLPIEGAILALAQDLFTDPADLAISHKLAVTLRQAAAEHPNWRLPDLTEELAVIARNERRYLGLSSDDTGFDPERYKGQVVVATLHKAKGLEWDRVYLMSVTGYDFPSGMEYEHFLPEKWFVRDRLNLEAETLAQLEAAMFSASPPTPSPSGRGGTRPPGEGRRPSPGGGRVGDEGETLVYEEGPATREARLEYIAERLRLLYVGITRARKELIVTWNDGYSGEDGPAIPLNALQRFSR